MIGRPAVVCIGTATIDTIALVDRYPAADERIEAVELRRAGGGQAATAAVALARLGIPAALVAVVGADEEGERIRADLAAENVDTSCLSVDSAIQSGASIVVVDRVGRTRAIINRPAPPPQMTPAAADLCRTAQWLHADHRGYPTCRSLNAPRPRLSLDGGNPVPGLNLAAVDLYAPTEERLVQRYGGVPLEVALTRALAEGAQTAVATRGPRGAVAATGDSLLTAPGVAVEVVSTLGAGDVFHGALLAGLVRDQPLATALAWATTAAGLSCRGLDGRSAIPDLAELSAHLPPHPADA